MTRLTLITVTHAAEIMSLKLQARSIHKFVVPEMVEGICVVANEVEDSSFRRAFAEHVMHEYGRFADRVRLIARKELLSGFDFTHGWRTQQVLKILAVAKSTSEICLVLDSKNHFVRRIETSSYLDQDEKLISCYVNQRGHLQEFFRNSFSYFGANPDQFIERSLPNVTPLALKVDTVRSMISMIEDREKKSFAEMFLVWPALYAEFYLVAGFIASRDGDFRSEYYFDLPKYVTIFADKAADGAFQALMSNTDRLHVLAFGIHWAARPLLTPKHKQLIARLWLSRGLIENLEEAELYFS